MKQLHHKYFVQGVKAFELTKPLSDFPADKDWEGGVADSPSTCDSTKTKVVVLQVPQVQLSASCCKLRSFQELVYKGVGQDGRSLALEKRNSQELTCMVSVRYDKYPCFC